MTDPTPGTTPLPPVTAILAVRNDVETLEQAVQSIVDQNYPLAIDIVVAAAPSTDGTAELLTSLSAANPRLTVLHTTSVSQVVALNEAIAAARSSLIIRVDPRGALPTDYAVRAVETMVRTDAAALVGRARPVGQTPFERAVAFGYRHRLGLAGDPLTSAAGEGPSHVAAAHVIRRRSFIEVGLYDEEIRHGQSWELNARLRAAGQTIWFTPSLMYRFRPPSKALALTRSLFAEGLWRGEFARSFPESRELRFALPPVVVLATILGFILGAGGLFGVVAGAIGVASVISFVLFALLIVPVAYVVSVIGLSIVVAARETLRVGVWFLLVLPFIHFCWGFGYLAGYLNIEGAADTVIVDFD
ncbi:MULTISPECIES: glycosyltransferase [Subtercola]|uniref:Glycosyltransferase n=1 Tax=Subtercola vilae TaxID=2056433 RepID=A0A4T2C0X2_9MICO|nr:MULTISPECIES: glycosyltransferase [Subtercola]MEA9985298.1 glycosyltransferase [Subtercola sp. RTI3]TIH35618.1 glycosyltransferase [Subtercola vilae]